MKVVITFTFCCGDLWKSKFMARENALKTRGIFFSYFVATLWLGDRRKGIQPEKDLL